MVVNNWIEANLIWITLAITVLVLMYFVYAIIQTIRKRRRFGSQLNTILLILGLMFLIFLTYHANEIEGKDWGQIILMLGLVIITALYASSTEKQANASVKMAEEMREQRIMSARPVIIQKAQQKKVVQATIVTDYFSHFEIYNAGNGPAIEPEIFLLDEEKSPIFLEDEMTYLRAGEAPVKLVPAEWGKVQSLPNWVEPPVKIIPIHLVIRENCTYLVSQYQSISSYGRQPIWYQTWLPFKSHRVNGQDEIRLTPGKLEFHEASEKKRIVMPLVKGKLK